MYRKLLFGVRHFFLELSGSSFYSVIVNRKINNMWLPCQQDPLLMVRSPVASYYPRYVESI